MCLEVSYTQVCDYIQLSFTHDLNGITDDQDPTRKVIKLGDIKDSHIFCFIMDSNSN